MNISKKALVLFAGSAVAIGGVASIGAQAFAQTSVTPTASVQTVSTSSEVAGTEVNTPEAPGTPDVQSGHQDAVGSAADTTEVTDNEAKDAPEAAGGPDVQVGHQDINGTDSTSGQ